MNKEERNLNLDPLTGASGAHPVGTGVGAVGGAAAGATVGMVGGPVGAAIGGVVGAVAGGLVGKGAAETFNPTLEETYWRDAYRSEPYYKPGSDFEEYAPAYRLGFNGRSRFSGDWEEVEPRLASDWETARSHSTLAWPEAKLAARAAWNRVTTPSMSMDNSVADGKIVSTLQDLAECCKDGEYGFIKSAEQATSPALKMFFTKRASGCREAANELNDHISDLGGTVQDSGTAAGAMHRGWIAVKTVFSTYDDQAVLEECERGEDHALASYRAALTQPMSAGLKQLIEHQMQGVQRNHAEIKRLRDSEAIGN